MTIVVGGDDGKGKPTSIVVPASCRDLLIQPTDFPTSSGVSLVPRLRGDDDKKETRMTEVVDGDDGKEEAGVSVIGEAYIYRRPGLVPGSNTPNYAFLKRHRACWHPQQRNGV